MELTDFKKILQGEALFRSKQAQKAVFKDLIKNWSQAMVLPLALRQKLNQELSLEIKAEENVQCLFRGNQSRVSNAQRSQKLRRNFGEIYFFDKNLERFDLMCEALLGLIIPFLADLSAIL